MPQLKQRPELAARIRLKFDRLSGKWLLLSPEHGLELSPTAHAIVELCDGTRELSEIARALGQRFSCDSVAEIERDLVAFTQALEGRALLRFHG